MILAKRLKIASAPKRNYFVAVGHNTSPFVTAYPWTASGGFGTKYANPVSLPAGDVMAIAAHPSGKAIAIAHANSPFFTVYEFSAGGFGAKYSSPALLPVTTGTDIAWSPDGSWLAVFDVNGTLRIYPFSLVTGIGAQVSSTAFGGGYGAAHDSLSFSPNADYLSLEINASPFFSIFPFNNSNGALSSALSGPVTPPNGSVYGIKWAPSQGAIAIANSHATATLAGYPFNGSIGTRFTNPSGAPTNTAYSLAFSPQGTFVVIGSSDTPFLHAYPWNDATGFGTKLSSPSPLPVDAAGHVVFSKTGDALFYTMAVSPYIVALAWNNGFGAKYSNPAFLPTGNANSVTFGTI